MLSRQLAVDDDTGLAVRDALAGRWATATILDVYVYVYAVRSAGAAPSGVSQQYMSLPLSFW
ncbi:hypothetical protein [Streptomyces sp. NPDC007205]|uniref:hypothetical protein n=1 Tax=Streptomyces sp. NPDC007205 TaxID=3154316 RepID=UPI0033D23588